MAELSRSGAREQSTPLGRGCKKYLGAIIAVIVLTVSLSLAEEMGPFKPSPTDKCPVCGMFVAKYPDFLAQIVFKDGTYAFFDGVKDMMKYYVNLPRYQPAKKTADIAAIRVMDYYKMKPTDGYQAYYVVGSDINGPMGRELIPFEDEAAAREFLRDHQGKKIVRFAQINPELLATLD
jgi:copper chaperone NosL